jgi:hypothetical protein
MNNPLEKISYCIKFCLEHDSSNNDEKKEKLREIFRYSEGDAIDFIEYIMSRYDIITGLVDK